jgi:hypothetical protein
VVKRARIQASPEPLTLETGQIARVNLKLEIGAMTGQVERWWG